MNAQDFLDKIGDFARKDMQKSGILASLTIAQAILESGWGKYDCGGNNLFGIKGRYNGQFVLCETKEYVKGQYVSIKEEFRKYPSWFESLQDHSAFIRGVKLGDGSLRYKAVIGEKDYKKACQAIHKAGYATSPVYADSLIKLIEQYNLNRFDNCTTPAVKPIANPQTNAVKSNDTIAKEVILGKWGNGQDRVKRLTKAGYNYQTIQGIVNGLCSKPQAKPVTKPVTKPAQKQAPKKTIDQLAKEVIRGDWGNGNDRKQRLTKAGYNYTAVQTAVNKLC